MFQNSNFLLINIPNATKIPNKELITKKPIPSSVIIITRYLIKWGNFAFVSPCFYVLCFSPDIMQRLQLSCFEQEIFCLGDTLPTSSILMLKFHFLLCQTENACLILEGTPPLPRPQVCGGGGGGVGLARSPKVHLSWGEASLDRCTQTNSSLSRGLN